MIDLYLKNAFSTRACPWLCLPEISSAACTLRIWRRPGSLRGHGNRVFRGCSPRSGRACGARRRFRSRTPRCAINWRSCSDRLEGDRGCGQSTGCSGRGCVTCGPVGGTRSSSSSPTRSSAGIDEAFGSTGAGRVGRVGPGGPASRAPFKNSSARCARANPTWGAPRIHGELLKLGITIAEATVGHYMVRRRPPPSQTWRTFLTNHVSQLVSVDFFVVPTFTFRVLFVFVVLAHDRRQILHVNVTGHPTAAWTAQQIRNAFPWDTAPRFLLRDRDGTYGDECRVLAPFAVDQAACLRADGEQRVDSSASSDSVGWTVTDTCTTATKIRRVRPPAVKMSRNAKRWLTRPACIAGVLVSRPNLNARCGRMKLS